jgi:hypothetical protein
MNKPMFSLWIYQLFGMATTKNFNDLAKLLGFWKGRRFKKLLRELEKQELLYDVDTRDSSADNWVNHFFLMYDKVTGGRFPVEGLPYKPLPSETEIMVLYENGRADHFEVIGERLRFYATPNVWITMDWPDISDKKCKFRLREHLSIYADDGRRFTSSDRIIFIHLNFPNEFDNEQGKAIDDQLGQIHEEFFPGQWEN